MPTREEFYHPIVYPAAAFLFGALLYGQPDLWLKFRHLCSMAYCVWMTGIMQRKGNSLNKEYGVKKLGKLNRIVSGNKIEETYPLIDYRLNDNINAYLIVSALYTLGVYFYCDIYKKSDKNENAHPKLKWIKKYKFYILTLSPSIYAVTRVALNVSFGGVDIIGYNREAIFYNNNVSDKKYIKTVPVIQEMSYGKYIHDFFFRIPIFLFLDSMVHEYFY
mmetsp:Transcript_67057/g.82147  ORF Transcript_67057/g.82147 Transcript_67057/m.82147 type:complete len:219 (-) Transcript_67057:52-708(-)